MYHTVAVTTEGDLYSWGRGLYGVLGMVQINTPLNLSLMRKFNF